MGRCDQQWPVWQSLFFFLEMLLACFINLLFSLEPLPGRSRSLWKNEKPAKICSATGKGEASVKAGDWTLLWRAPAPSDIRSGQKATTWSFCLQWPDVVGSELCLLKLFLQKVQFNLKHWGWLLTKGVVWCHYLPANIHPTGIGTERAQNFI